MDNVLKIEAGIIGRVYDVLGKNAVSGKMLFISDDLVFSLYGELVQAQLQKLGTVRLEIIDDNSIAYAMSLAERVIATDVEYVVGLGGGRVLDVCKYAAYVSKRPFISIPTTIANDGIASPIAVLKRKDGKPKSLGSAIPKIVLLDTQLLLNGPLHLIKAGIGDTISNYMALQDWRHACDNGKDKMNDYAYLMSKTALDSLMNTTYEQIDLAFLQVLTNAIVLSGLAMDFCGSSRPVSGSEHLFSHALDYYCNTSVPHGYQVALGTVAILMLMDLEYGAVLDYLRRFEVDINPASLGICQKDFVCAMKNATQMRSNRYTYLHEIEIDDQLLEQLYSKLVEVI